MKKPLLFLLFLSSFILPTTAKNSDYNYNHNAPDSLFTREAPDIDYQPDTFPQDDAQWVDVYVSNAYPNTVKMQNPGVIWNYSDRTIQYTLDIISPRGFHNISQEVLHCGSQKVKTLAYGDTHNHRWIEVAKPQWRQVASAIASHDMVRTQIYRTLCDNGYPLQEKELQERISNLGFK